MQALAETQRHKKSTTDRALFGAHLTMLGGFVAVVGYLAVACHHVH